MDDEASTHRTSQADPRSDGRPYCASRREERESGVHAMPYGIGVTPHVRPKLV
jgi:hypothetical protein